MSGVGENLAVMIVADLVMSANAFIRTRILPRPEASAPRPLPTAVFTTTNGRYIMAGRCPAGERLEGWAAAFPYRGGQVRGLHMNGIV